MNILVIGNGFDLAHGLPTKYTDFLYFCIKILDISEENRSGTRIKKEWLVEDKMNERLNEILINIYKARMTFKDGNKYDSYEIQFLSQYYWVNEFMDLVANNIWIEYFRKNIIYQKENWIDFESEISKLIQYIDSDMHSDKRYELDDIVGGFSNDFLCEKYTGYLGRMSNTQNMIGDFQKTITFREVRNKLLSDLNKLIRALEIFLVECVEKMECRFISPDIGDIQPDKVLSFNYTDTYRKVYDRESFSGYDFIHGKANANGTIDTNNMVMGIDEYLPDERKNKDVEFIAFKKYYQRIHNQTGCKYKEWVEEIKLPMETF